MTATADPFVFFHSSRRVIHGLGAIDKLADLAREHGARRTAVVMDAFFIGTALAERVASLLAGATGTRPAVHGVPAHEPDVDSITACYEALQSAQPDLVVAIGGGSAMDTAKVARMLLSNPGTVQSIAGFGKAMRPHASLLICVPTTAGTGSEVSESAVASQNDSDVKLIFRSQEMTPQIALLDPELSITAPARVTAQSGYDAVTHAVEAFVSKAASVMTDPFALTAMRLLGKWLPVAYREPEHREARSWCLIASCQAAIAFNSANLGLAHAIAAPLGALHDVPHGLGNALALPAVIAFNESALGDKAALVAQAFGASSPAEGLSKLRRDVGLDIGLDEIVPDAAARERVAQAAMKSGQVRMNPRLASIDDMRVIIESMRAPTGGGRPQLKL